MALTGCTSSAKVDQDEELDSADDVEYIITDTIEYHLEDLSRFIPRN